MSKIKDTLMVVRHAHHVDKVLKDDQYLSHRLEADIIRNVHSIEKGLSLEHPRKLFGLKKINTMIGQVDQYMKQSDVRSELVQMAVDALYTYLQFHNDKEYSELAQIKVKVNEYAAQYPTAEIAWGGYSVSL